MFEEISKRKWRFLLVFLAVFTVTLLVLTLLDWVPENSADSTEDAPAQSAVAASATPPAATVAQPDPSANVPAGADPLPRRIVIDKIGVDAPIINDPSTDIDTLNTDLESGVVRYPTSATMTQTGNVLLFGHASHLAYVHNQMYKVFTRVSELSAGDFIRVQTNDREYLYRVTSVTLVDADDTSIKLSTDARHLTISTCDTLGEKSDRYIVQSDFVSSSPISP
jgi:sortase A